MKKKEFSGILAKRPQAAGTLNLLTDRKDSKSNVDLSEIILALTIHYNIDTDESGTYKLIALIIAMGEDLGVPALLKAETSSGRQKKDSLEKIKLIALVNEKIKSGEAKGVLTACRSLIKEKSITGEEKSLKSSYFQYKKDLKLDLPISDSIFEKTIDNMYQSIKNK